MYGYYNPYVQNAQMAGQQPYQQPYGQNQMQRQDTPHLSDSRIWVQNETAAESYLVAPNSFVRLWDASQPVFYEKRSDATGRPLPLEVYEYKRKQAQNGAISTDAVTSLRADINSLNERILRLEERRETYVPESNADDSKLQSVPAAVPRRSKSRGAETAPVRTDESATV